MVMSAPAHTEGANGPLESAQVGIDHECTKVQVHYAG
jgi:hypothetical protein